VPTKGGHVEVADRIEEHHELGIDEFILSGHPHLEGGLLIRRGAPSSLAAARSRASTAASR
jgi:alkanesulfonate monooxygenase